MFEKSLFSELNIYIPLKTVLPEKVPDDDGSVRKNISESLNQNNLHETFKRLAYSLYF